MNYTSIEQSKKLLELGLNSKSADLIYGSYAFDGSPENGDENLPTTFEDPETKHWYYVDFAEPFYTEDWTKSKKYPDIPCWSVGALTELIPAYVIEKHPLSDKIVVWSCGLNSGEQDSLLDACYNMIIYLLENGYIKKGE